MKTPDGSDIRQGKRKAIFGGVFVRKECWRLSYKGWGLGLGLAVIFALLMRGFIYGFLALNEPINSDCIVVEGWLERDCMTKAAHLIQNQKIHCVFTTGGDASEEWGTSRGETYAELGKERLASLGVRKEEIIAVPSRVTRRDRTYTSALALREWSIQSGKALASFNLITQGPHARRSHLLFKRAFGPAAEIGVIALTTDIDEKTKWWQTSVGVREVFFESIAYLYASVIFHPRHDDLSR